MNLLRFIPRFRKANALLKVLSERENWYRAEIEAFQLERLNTLWHHARYHVPYYRNLCRELALPDKFQSLEEFKNAIPVLPKAVVRENRFDFISNKARPGWWSRTGGSTGTPMTIYWGEDAHLEMLRTQYRFRQIWGVKIHDKMAYLWGNSVTTKPGWEGLYYRLHVRMYDTLRNRVRLSAYDLGTANLESYLKRLSKTAPKSIYGYPSALNLLATEAERRHTCLPSLKALFLTGEPAFSPVVKNLERIFRIPAVIEYGSYECGFTAYECPDRTLRVREDVTMVETIPAENNKHKLIISVLTNPSFPLLRYSIEDITDEPVEYPEQGFAILKNVIGRNNDMIVSATGHYIHSARFDAFFKYQCKHVRRFRMYQRPDGSIRVWLELNNGAAASDIAGLDSKLIELVQGYFVEVSVVDSLPNLESGKHRSVISELVKPYGVESVENMSSDAIMRF